MKSLVITHQKNISHTNREKYGVLSMILDDISDLLAQAHQDWVQLLSTSDAGRDGYTSEQLLRALIVMFIEGKSYRNTIVLIDNSEFLQHFVRLGIKSMMDFTFLNRAYCALGATTIDTMNAILTGYAITEEMISREKQRMHTTVYETNIHYPTDSSLLWDSFRTLARLKCQYTTLIHLVRWIHGVGQHVCKRVLAAGYDVVELSHYLPLVLRIVHQADCRIIQDETVPPDEKFIACLKNIPSLSFAARPVTPIEFGHKILVAQTGEKYIHHYQVMEKWIEDKELLVPAIEAHKDLLSTDKGFYESMKQIHSLEEIIRWFRSQKKAGVLKPKSNGKRPMRLSMANISEPGLRQASRS